MAINSRSKGSAAEREVAKLIYDNLGIKMKRNLEQSRSGGYDLVPDESGTLLDEFAIEVKRYAKISDSLLAVFWRQTFEQADAVEKIPVLIYREDRGDWKVVISLHVLMPSVFLEKYGDIAIIGVYSFFEFVRER